VKVLLEFPPLAPVVACLFSLGLLPLSLLPLIFPLQFVMGFGCPRAIVAARCRAWLGRKNKKAVRSNGFSVDSYGFSEVRVPLLRII
jgi:hypothetical protein